jgi:hypothetical protein
VLKRWTANIKGFRHPVYQPGSLPSTLQLLRLLRLKCTAMFRVFLVQDCRNTIQGSASFGSVDLVAVAGQAWRWSRSCARKMRVPVNVIVEKWLPVGSSCAAMMADADLGWEPCFKRRTRRPVPNPGRLRVNLPLGLAWGRNAQERDLGRRVIITNGRNGGFLTPPAAGCFESPSRTSIGFEIQAHSHVISYRFSTKVPLYKKWS